MDRHNFSLRQRLDVVFGVLLIMVALGASLSLELARRQRRDARFVAALSAQEPLAVELTALADVAVAHAMAHHDVTDTHRASLERVEQRLRDNLTAFVRGGWLNDGDGASVRVLPGALERLEPSPAVVVERLDAYHRALASILHPGTSFAPAQAAMLQPDITRRGEELRLLIKALVAQVESRSLDVVVQASQMQLAFIVWGMILFTIGIAVVHRLVTTPLHRMADGIAAMQRTGRLVKLPVPARNELGIVADGFNQLADQVEAQKVRLREHIVELQRMNVELDRLATLKDDFLETINHQLRTPLAAIMEGVELLRDAAGGPLTMEQQALVETLRENAKRLDQLVEDVLDLSLLKSGRRQLRRRPADLAALIRRTAEAWRAAAKSRQLTVTCGALPPVYLDEPAIQEVLDHLLRNAIRHAPEQTVIGLEATIQNALVQVSIQDQGPGLSPKQIAQLFQPFVHLHTPEAPGSQGNGLGLAYCRQIIERHRGTIHADSAAEGGLRIRFTLPVASPAFLFDEACRLAQEEAQREDGQYGLLLVSAPGAGSPVEASAWVHEAEAMLSRHTHRGDQFVWLDDVTLVIIAITDREGASAMSHRLRQVIQDARLRVTLTEACYPVDGEEPGDVLAAAKRRSCAATARRVAS